jgi:hypothetical protein
LLDGFCYEMNGAPLRLRVENRPDAKLSREISDGGARWCD